MRIRLLVPTETTAPALLEPALEAVTRANEADLRRGRVPTFDRALAQRKVRWRPEPPGDEHFDLARVVLGRGWGDCDDLAPWHAASLRATGEDPDASVVVRRSGPSRWHAVVRRGDGSIDDPSRAAGMGKPEGAVAPTTRPVVGALPGAAAQKAPWGAWIARVEVPWGDRYGLAVHRVGDARLVVGVQALDDAARIADVVGHDDAARRMRAARDMLCGVDPYRVTQRHAVDGFSLADLTKPFSALKSVAEPALRAVQQAAAPALQAAAPALQAAAPALQAAAPLLQFAPAAMGPMGLPLASMQPLMAAILRSYGLG